MKKFDEFRKFILECDIAEYIKETLVQNVEKIDSKEITAENFAALLTSTNLIITLDVLERYHEWLNS